MNSDTPAPPPQVQQIAVPEIPVDPTLEAQQQQAQQTLITGLQNQARGDTASLMARYGTRLALAGSSTAPMSASPS